jgi:hypothetical protein
VSSQLCARNTVWRWCRKCKYPRTWVPWGLHEHCRTLRHRPTQLPRGRGFLINQSVNQSISLHPATSRTSKPNQTFRRHRRKTPTVCPTPAMAQITDASIREAITQRLQATHVEVTDMSGSQNVAPRTSHQRAQRKLTSHQAAAAKHSLASSCPPNSRASTLSNATD